MRISTEIERINDALYIAEYRTFDEEELNRIWDSIKDREELLSEAIKVVLNNYNRETFAAPDIVSKMLKSFNDFSPVIYRELVSKIYGNKTLARLYYLLPDQNATFGYSLERNSYLCMTLWNQRLILSEEEKNFVTLEAMNTYGSTRGINNPEIIKASNMEAGNTHPGIQLLILRNQNFLDRFPKLVYDFWADDEEYEEMLTSLINHAVYDYLDDNGQPFVDISEVEYITAGEIRERTPEELAFELITDIELIQNMLKVRAPKSEFDLENNYQY